MEQLEFERYLFKKVHTRRIIMCLTALGLLAMGIGGMYLLEATKEVILHEHQFIPTWEEVKYNYDYLYYIVFGFWGAFMAGSLVLIDFLVSGFRVFQAGTEIVTIYRSMIFNIVYIDGVQRGRRGPFAFLQAVECQLADGTNLSIIFNRGLKYYAYVVFSDDTESMYI